MSISLFTNDLMPLGIMMSFVCETWDMSLMSKIVNDVTKFILLVVFHK